MSKASRKAKIPHRPASEAIPMVRNAYHRTLLLLSLCDKQIPRLFEKSAKQPDDASTLKEVQGLSRTVLNLQNAADKYAAILFPPLPLSEASPGSSDASNLQQKVADTAPLAVQAGISEQMDSTPLAPSDRLQAALKSEILDLKSGSNAPKFGYVDSSLRDATPTWHKKEKAKKFSETFFKRSPHPQNV